MMYVAIILNIHKNTSSILATNYTRINLSLQLEVETLPGIIDVAADGAFR